MQTKSKPSNPEVLNQIITIFASFSQHGSPRSKCLNNLVANAAASNETRIISGVEASNACRVPDNFRELNLADADASFEKSIPSRSALHIFSLETGYQSSTSKCRT